MVISTIWSGANGCHKGLKCYSNHKKTKTHITQITRPLPPPPPPSQFLPCFARITSFSLLHHHLQNYFQVLYGFFFFFLRSLRVGSLRLRILRTFLNLEWRGNKQTMTLLFPPPLLL